MTNRHLRFPVLLAILAALVTMALKSAAWWITGSVGLLSDAAESLVNLMASGFAYLALLIAARPADRSHAYGHEKIEYFSSGLEGGLIFVAAVSIAWAAIDRLIAGKAVQSLDVGLALSLVAALINLAVAQLLLRVGRRHHSIVLEADGKHLMTDVWTSVGVLAGLGLVWLTRWYWIDPVLAMLVAANILWTAGGLLWRSFEGLMDRALTDDELARIRTVIQSHLEEGMTYHAVRTRRAGSRRFADFHLLVPGELSVRRAHDLADRIEDALREALPNLEVTTHIEPVEARSSYDDSAMLPVEEANRGG